MVRAVAGALRARLTRRRTKIDHAPRSPSRGRLRLPESSNMKAVMLAVFAVVASQAIAQTSDQPAAAKGTAAKPALGTWGIDLTNMDRSVKPGDDFYPYGKRGGRARD